MLITLVYISEFLSRKIINIHIKRFYASAIIFTILTFILALVPATIKEY